MKIEFNTNDYEFANGKKPSGRGSWAFSAFRKPAPANIFWVHGKLYSEAKAEAAKYFGEISGVSVVYVLS